MIAAAARQRALSTVPSFDCRIGAIDGLSADNAIRLGACDEQTLLAVNSLFCSTQADRHAG